MTQTATEAPKPRSRRRTLEERLEAAKEAQRKKLEEQKEKAKTVRSLTAKIENKRRKESDKIRSRRLILLGLTFSWILQEDPALLEDAKKFITNLKQRDEAFKTATNKRTAKEAQKNVHDYEITIETLNLIESGRPLTEPIQVPPIQKDVPAQEPEATTEPPEPEADPADSPKP